ncbi:hypothetical protein BCR33DRAFT_781761 [Rhizoclosmatium globosum]|uniref:Uncharacterized protein n=1 Tax=Rhizoclosmatium globosum TaxID=329046 RepID=A0A1Y2CT11_9FUNG|nr:hypothetical protein BCR33DRAFT_781761 [Rhizoclosmatium globosum]|eukprot:ORY49505.1 hypothetical protein BCR33DRAFT_781761 [Rhizoclosmatium globosum]
MKETSWIDIYLYIWIPLIQQLLDEYSDHVNHNRRQANKNCLLLSAAPHFCYSCPNRFGGMNCGISVDMQLIDDAIATLQSDPLIAQYLPEDAKVAFEIAYNCLGRPRVELTNAWELVHKIQEIIVNTS